jgi:hypothetical protein
MLHCGKEISKKLSTFSSALANFAETSLIDLLAKWLLFKCGDIQLVFKHSVVDDMRLILTQKLVCLTVLANFS